VRVDAITGLVVDADAEAGIQEQGVEMGESGEFVADVADRGEVLEVGLVPVDLGGVAPVGEGGDGGLGVLFFVGEEVDCGGVVLEEVRDDAVADSC